MKTIHVKIADLAAVKEEAMLVTIGLGSCVGVALYDPKSKVAGLAHILLDDSTNYSSKNREFNPAKFADTAIPLLLSEMEKLGACRDNVVAKIAGGSSLFKFNFGKNENGIGARNVEMVRVSLKKMGIAICGEDVGGSYGRTMKLSAANGKVTITTAGRGEKVL